MNNIVVCGILGLAAICNYTRLPIFQSKIGKIYKITLQYNSKDYNKYFYSLKPLYKMNTTYY